MNRQLTDDRTQSQGPPAASGFPDLRRLDAFSLGSQVRQGQLKAVEVWDFFYRLMADRQPEIGAFLELFEEDRRQAEEIDRRLRDGEDVGPLAGVPVAIKDNIAYADHPLTCASKILQGYVSPFSATAVQRLVDAGAVILGRTNMDELGMGSSCERSAFGPTRNPWQTDCAPGGSSGGSAAAVALGLPLALGSDTGGSIRQPAAFCGVVGLKPSYGRISRYGLVAFASSTDQIGPLTPDVASAASALELMAGVDSRDATSSQAPVDNYRAALEKADHLNGVRIGVVEQVNESDLSTDVADDWRRSRRRLSDLGAELKPVSVANLGAAIACYYVISNCEASTNLSRLDGMRYGRRATAGKSLDEAYGQSRYQGLGAEVRRRILLGTFALSSGYYEAYYARAQAVRRALRRQLEEAFREVDVIITPTSPTAAFAIGERTEDPLSMYLADIFTTAPSLAGLAGLSVPSGLDSRGLPLGLQILGRPLDELGVLKVGHAFERQTAFPRLNSSGGS